MKVAKWSWISGSILINVIIAFYIYLSSKAPLDEMERAQYVIDNWTAYSLQWRFEFILVVLLAIGALYYSIETKKVSWVFILMGQMILLTLYPIMLGGYDGTAFELSTMANQIAIVIFNFGNVVFLSGCFLLYYESRESKFPQWLSRLGMGLSLVCTFVFLACFFEFISFRDVFVIGPLVNLVYFINAFYVYRMH